MTAKETDAAWIHSCSYHCNEPDCIKSQRNQLVRRFIEQPDTQDCVGIVAKSLNNTHIGWLKEVPDNACLYLHPEKNLQGLTDEEIHSITGYQETREIYRFARAIEAKLKEKNNGL